MMQSPAPIQLDLKGMFRLYSAGEHERLSEEFLRVLDHFTRTIVMSDATIRAAVAPFLKVFLTLFTQPDYLVPARHVAPFIGHNALLANLAAMSPLRNTDAFLEMLREQPSNFVKILTLYSARNTVHFDRRRLFDADPQTASLWYNLFCETYKAGLPNENVVRQLTEHLSYHDDRMTLGPDLAIPYFSSSYVDGCVDRAVKPLLNHLVRRSSRLAWDNRPDPRKIAVISDYWYPEHSVYRNYAAYVKELHDAYHLTLVHVLTPSEKLDASMFDEVHRLETRDGMVFLDGSLAKDFQVAYFPDVGMTQPSILLANCRLAPLQICSPGHSVSTWGAEIDYFLSGADVEIASSPEQNYSERLVLLPGMGAIHNRPRHELTGAKKDVAEIVVNCPWSGHKINARFLRTLRRLLDRAARPVRMRIFAGTGISQHNGHLPFLTDLRAALGEGAIIDLWPQLPYAEYMQYMEQGDLTLDSFHFAGCNTVADSLFVRKPTVVWEGDKWYNRIGPAMLRLVGLDELICTTEDEYLDKAHLLIHDDHRRGELTARLQAADLDATVFSTRHAPAFRRAIEYLIANHEELKRQGSKKPIVIA
jgi:hypothetical protein